MVICKPINYTQVRSIISKSPSVKLSKIKRRPAESRINHQIQENIRKQQLFRDEEKKLGQKKDDIHELLKFKDFIEIDWKKDANEIERLKQEITVLEQTSDQLKILNEQLKSIEEQIKNVNQERSELENNKGNLEGKIVGYNGSSQKCVNILANNPFTEAQDLPNINEYLQKENYTIESIDRELDKTQKSINKIKESNESQEKSLGLNIVAKMFQYKSTYPAETIDIPLKIESIPEFIGIHDKIKYDNLPKYEENFKKYLREGTIQSIASFKLKLETNAKDIKKNIKTINNFLRQLEYNRGTYIELISEDAPENDIREFKAELRDCIAETFGNEDVYNEDRFYKVKKLLDKFKGATLTENNWTNRVTDVRNWLTFSATEKFFNDNTEKEFYNDSSGKSGGQKEKLAYTILASALAYRFGPAGNRARIEIFPICNH